MVTLYQQAHPGIDFRFQPGVHLPIFEFDRDQVKRVMINLLDNAVSAFSEAALSRPGGAWVELRTEYEETLQIARLVVRDNGPGMTPDVLERVFEPYFSTKKEGTGLGLAIVKRIINDHNGVIRVESQKGEGTQFLVELPSSIWQGLNRP